MIKGIIDRFEGNIVVVEIDGETNDFPRKIFPKTTKPGDVVTIDGDKVTIDQKETEKLRKEIEDLIDEVWDD